MVRLHKIGNSSVPDGPSTPAPSHAYPALPDPDVAAKVGPEDPANLDLDYALRRKDPNMGNLPDGSWEGKNGQHLTPTDNADVQQFAADSIRAADNVTPRLEETVTRADPDAVLVGLEDRVKFPDSLKGKVSTMMLGDGLTAEEALTKINDSLRYTVQVPSGSYSSVVDSVVSDMKTQGLELVRFKNTWGFDGYKGINTTWRDPGTGKLFELQFHTPESFYTKTVSHEIYERLRLPGLTPEEADLLEMENTEIFQDLEVPDGAREIEH